ncbi:unnamed protein product [Adineta steineri]|uniref:Uncharacterized protein n=1 Tax=Adineta steineri TaxID=433720 RepID=A0A814CM47_9BILA|nr:unnamed protein product [Adineta steineri]
MVNRDTRLIIANIFCVFIDIFNLAEQLGIYFIAKDNDLDESSQQRFFFILFGVGGASLFKSLLCHPVARIIFSMCIETGELVSYLTLLPNSTNLMIVAILFFVLEIIFHMLSIICICGISENNVEECGKNCCLLPLRIFLYGTLFETQIFFLFLDANSPFRDTFYEVLMVLATFFGLPMVDIATEKACHIEDKDEEKTKVLEVWEGFLRILGAIIDPILIITAVVYCSLQLQNRDGLKTYDFVIYIITIISYGSIVFAIACALGCTLCICAGAFVAFLKKCLCPTK